MIFVEGGKVENIEKELVDEYYENLSEAVGLPEKFITSRSVLSTQEDRDRWSFYWYTAATDLQFAVKCKTNRWPVVWRGYWRKRLDLMLSKGFCK